jgi:hypothetical protein
MTNHHLLLACFLPAKRISRKHDRSPEGMAIWSIGLFGLFFIQAKGPHSLETSSIDQNLAEGILCASRPIRNGRSKQCLYDGKGDSSPQHIPLVRMLGFELLGSSLFSVGG